MVDRRRSLELAGMTVDENGQLGRSVDTLYVLRPNGVGLDVERRVLQYRTDSPLVADAFRPDVLDSFVALADASDERICEFAQRYGVLEVEPLSKPGWYEEDLARWHYWAARARAILSASASLHQDQPVSDEDWKAMDAPTAEAWTQIFSKRSGLTHRQRSLGIGRAAVGDLLNDFLQVTGVRPCFTWLHGGSGIMLTNLTGPFDEGGLSLAGVLAVQLVLACSGAQSIATCSGCQMPYTRRWHSPKGRRNYCPSCGKRAAWRDSKRARRSAEGAAAKSVSRNQKRGAK